MIWVKTARGNWGKLRTAGECCLVQEYSDDFWDIRNRQNNLQSISLLRKVGDLFQGKSYLLRHTTVHGELGL